jgi:hypothetical protein
MQHDPGAAAAVRRSDPRSQLAAAGQLIETMTEA